MKFALGVLCLWWGAVLLHIAARGIEATTPWGAWQTILSSLGEGGSDAT